MWGIPGRLTKRPWGHFITYISNHKFTVKDIVVNPGQPLSLQTHRRRDEFWAWVDGTATRITIGEHMFYMEAGMEYTVPRGVKHRIENLSDAPCTVLEGAYGRFDENDIIRYKDNYGRA